MKDNLTPSHGYKFGPYHADTVALELRKSGIRIRLQPKPFQVLKVLLERAGQTVSREELKKLLWSPDIFVDLEHRHKKNTNKKKKKTKASPEGKAQQNH